MQAPGHSNIKEKNFAEFLNKAPAAAPKGAPASNSSKTDEIAKATLAVDDFLCLGDENEEIKKKEASAVPQKPLSKKDIKVLERMAKNREAQEKKQNELAKKSAAAAIMRGQRPLIESPAAQAAPAVPVSNDNPDIEPIEPDKQANGKISQKLPVVVIKRKFDEDYINNALQTFDEITVNITNALFKLMAEPIIKENSTDESIKGITDSLKDFTKKMLNFGDIAEKQFAKLCEFKIIDQAAQKKYNNLLNWIISNEFMNEDGAEKDREYLHAVVRKKLTEGEGKLESYQLPYLEQSLLWIFDANPKREKTFREYIQDIRTPSVSEEDAFEHGKKVCHLVLKALIDIKIELYCDAFKGILQTQLGQLLVHQIRDHVASPLVRFETEHLMTCIHRLPWKSLVDNMVYTIKDHTGAYLEGVRGFETFDAGIEDGTYTKLTPEETEQLAKWQAYLANPNSFSDADKNLLEQNRATLELYADIVAKQRMLREEYFWLNFADHKGSVSRIGSDGKPSSLTAHEVVQKIIFNKIGRQNPEVAKRAAESNADTFYNKKAEQIVNILFSTDMNGIDFWYKNLSLSDDFKKYGLIALDLSHKVISDRVFETFNEVIENPDKASTLKKIGNTILESCISYLKTKMIEILSKQLKSQLEQWSDPDQLKQLFAETLLPNVIIPKLVFVLAKQVFYANLDNYAGMMLKALHAPDSEKANKELDILKEALYNQLTPFLPNAPLKKLGQPEGNDETNPEKLEEMGKQFFIQTFNPFLTDTFNRLKAIKERDDLLQTTLETVKENLIEYNTSPEKELEQNPQYGLLIHNLLFEMTPLKKSWVNTLINSRESWDTSTKSALSNILISSLDDMRKSPEQLVNMLMSSFASMYAPGKPSEDAFSGKPSLSRQGLRDNLKSLYDKRKELMDNNNGGIKSKEIHEVNDEIYKHPINSTNRKYDLYMRRTADLIYDFAMKTLGETARSWYVPGFLGRTLGRTAVLGTPDNFHNMVTSLFTQLFGDITRNTSMNLQIAGDLIDALFKESQNIRKETKDLAEKANFEQSEKARQEKEKAAEIEKQRLEQELIARLRPQIENEIREKIRLEQLAAAAIAAKANPKPGHKRNSSS